MIQKNPFISGREIAFIVLYENEKKGGFLSDYLLKYCLSKEIKLAQEIAYGVMRRKLTLDFFARNLASKGHLRLKSKERVLLRIALYQHVFMKSMPLYAIAAEMGELAKKYTGKIFSSFLNAILRKLEKTHLLFPEQLDLRYSFPKAFVQKLLDRYGMLETQNLLDILNQPGTAFCRLRNIEAKDVLKVKDPWMDEMFKVDALLIDKLKDSPDIYFQNPTQVYLLKKLAFPAFTPARILDLCAAPGGKTLLLHDLYPNSAMHANDISQKRIQKLKENMQKYGLNAVITQKNGEDYSSKNPFDLVLVDAPCSNSGVFHKRPEARWRLDELTHLTNQQFKLLSAARSLLAKGGQIWYLTCSILFEENEKLIQKACKELDLKVESEMHLVLPNREGWDGGFACALMKA